MKKIYRSILLVLLALSSLGAADLMRPRQSLTPVSGGVRVELDFSAISADVWGSMLTSPEAFHEFGYGVYGGPDDPALPQLTIIVPFSGTGEASIHELELELTPLSGVEIKSTPPPHLDSQEAVDLAHHFDWSRSRTEEIAPVELGEMVVMGDKILLPVTVRPVVLGSHSADVQVCETISFDLLGISLAENVLVGEGGNPRSVSTAENHFGPRGHYLIITPSNFEPALAQFVAWKERMGYEVTVVTTSVTGGSASSIKNYIQGVWDSGENRPDFLLLVGDEDRGIPGHYIQNPQGDYLVTDHPYACLEGDDSFPELMVGRLSVDTMTELLVFTNKIINYESSPHMTNSTWFEKALVISTTWSAASCQATKEWVKDKMLENGFDQVTSAFHPSVYSPTAISIPINNGVGYVNYRGFGMYNGWYGPEFYNSDIDNLINNGAKTPVITSIVCGGGNFAAGVDPCFGEKWVREGTVTVPGGAVAFMGPSELYTHTQFNNVIDIGIYSAIFDQDERTLGKAFWNGKYELWRNYHQNTYFPFGQTPYFYHHIYNLLGDPGMQLWTATPQYPTVNHPASLSAGSGSVQVEVLDASGLPVENAYVFLHNSENANGTYTDASGIALVPLSHGSENNIQLTITGKNLYPYLADVDLEASAGPIDLDSWSLLNDDFLESGQNHLMLLNVNNSGEPLSGAVLNLSANHPGVSLPNSIDVGDLPSGLTELEFLVSVEAQIHHDTPVMISVELSAGSDTYMWDQVFIIQSSVVSVHGLELNSGNYLPGQTASVNIVLSNTGGADASLLSLVPISDAFVSYSLESLACPHVPIDGLADVEEELDIIFSEQLFPGERVELKFLCEEGDRADTLSTWVQVGEVVPFGPSQRDAYGYRVFDNFDLSYSKSRAYDWVELDITLGGNGNLVGMTDFYEEDDDSRVFALPFEVNFYGQTFSQITICTNGWAAFGNQGDRVNFHNRVIPSPIGPSAKLAPFWDDLVTSPGTVLHRHDVATGRYIIQWSRMQHLLWDEDLSFQIIIYDTAMYPTERGDNDILFQYKNFSNDDIDANFCTIGIESPDYSTGIQVSYNSFDHESLGELGNNTALLFSSDRGERLPDATVEVTMPVLDFSLSPWSSIQDSILIENTGETPLMYNIQLNNPALLLPPAPAYDSEGITKSSESPVFEGSAVREGTDAFGYTWKMTGEEGGPVYSWVDIETPVNQLDYTGDPDDGTITVPIGFDFPFYDGVYTQMHIGSNGTITFQTATSPWLNQHLPSASAPAALLAPWWEDMNNEETPLGTFYFWSNEIDQCIITWKDFPKWGTYETYTFQTILDAYGKIIYQYQDMNGPTYSATIGQQNLNRNIGLEIFYNETTDFEDEKAISIRRPFDWFTASGWSGQLAPDETAVFAFTVATQNMEAGSYEMPLRLVTSASNLDQMDFTVNLDVIYGETPPGDLNGDYLSNAADVIFLMNIITELTEASLEQMEAADYYDDGVLNVMDLLLLLELILN